MYEAGDLASRKAIIFDFDGTIADTKASIIMTASTVLAQWGVTDEELSRVGEIIGPPFPQAFQWVFGFSLEDAIEITRRYRVIYEQLGVYAWPAFEGMCELLRELRREGRLLAVASSKRTYLVRRGLDDNGIVELFDSVRAKETDLESTKADAIRLVLEDFPDVKVGFSDHVAPDDTMMTLATAYLLGAEVIEKHFTLDKTLPGNDHYHGGDPEDFKKAIRNFQWIDKVLGSPEKTVLDCEIIPRREARRSLVLTRDMKAGEVIKAEDLMPKRPGTGISPRFADIVIGRKVTRDLDEDTILTWDMV